MDDFLKELWFDLAGKKYISTQRSLDELRSSEWSLEFQEKLNFYDRDFFRYCQNRLIMGAMRYGLLGQDKPKWDRMSRFREEFDKYVLNYTQSESLVDAFNMLMLEYVEGDYNKEKLVKYANALYLWWPGYLILNETVKHNREIR